MNGKLIGYKLWKSKKGSEMITFFFPDPSLNGIHGTCTMSIMGMAKAFPEPEKMLGKNVKIFENDHFASGDWIEVKNE